MQREDIEKLEKVIGQMEGLHNEIGALAKKSPNDGLNKFKLKFVNSSLSLANELLGRNYKPFDDFSVFDEDDVPSNSDVTMIVSQYLEAIERYRADNIKNNSGTWSYRVDEDGPYVRAAPPKKLTRK